MQTSEEKHAKKMAYQREYRKNNPKYKEYNEANKDRISQYQREYREVNRESISTQRKGFRGVNKERLTEKSKEYYEANKDSIAEKKKKYVEVNRERISEQRRVFRESNKDRLVLVKKGYYQKNKEHLTIYRRRWREENKAWHAPYCRQKCAARRAGKAQRTPIWADHNAIAFFYDCCPKGCHIDHVIPLHGKDISGLHVETNLQWLSAEQNHSKGHRWPHQLS